MTEEGDNNNRGLALTKAVNGGDSKLLPLQPFLRVFVSLPVPFL